MTAPPIRAQKTGADALAALDRSLLLDLGRCCKDFGLIEHQDRVMVALSGGKDSFTMLHLLMAMRKRTPFSFELFAVTIDQGQPGFRAEPIVNHVTNVGIPFHLVKQDTYSIVKEKVPAGKTYCSLCSRLRRGILYRVASELGATKIALGHHRDDLIETLLLNLLYSGQTKAMPARLVSDDNMHVVIRPMAYLAESDIADFARLKGFPVSTCDTCGSQDNLHRKKIKKMLIELEEENPKVKGNLFAALTNVVPTHLLDRSLLERLGMPVRPIQTGRTRRSYELEVLGSQEPN